MDSGALPVNACANDQRNLEGEQCRENRACRSRRRLFQLNQLSSFAPDSLSAESISVCPVEPCADTWV